MFQAFKKYITEKVDLTEKELQLIESLSIKRKIRKRQFLLHEGEICNHKCFVAKGFLRSYRINEEGKEHILAFATENWWISDMESYNNKTPTKINIDALEDSEVLLWTKDNFDELLRTIPSFSIFRENLLARSFDASQNRIFANISFTAEEKYENFLRSYPDIFNRVPLHMVASYLGISRETLSRIRNHYSGKSS